MTNNAFYSSNRLANVVLGCLLVLCALASQQDGAAAKTGAGVLGVEVGSLAPEFSLQDARRTGVFGERVWENPLL